VRKTRLERDGAHMPLAWGRRGKKATCPEKTGEKSVGKMGRERKKGGDRGWGLKGEGLVLMRGELKEDALLRHPSLEKHQRECLLLC